MQAVGTATPPLPDALCGCCRCPACLPLRLPPRPLPEPFELRLLVRGREGGRRAERPGAAPRYEGSCSGDGGGKEARDLREAPQARPPGPEGVLRDVEGMLDGAAHGGLRRFGRQVFPRERGAPLRHMPGDPCEARAGGCPAFRTDMASIGPDALVALPHEARQPAQVVDVGRIGARAMGDAAPRVRPDAELVPEVPVLAPLRLVRRNRASLRSSWWGMGPPRRRHPRWCCGPSGARGPPPAPPRHRASPRRSRSPRGDGGTCRASSHRGCLPAPRRRTASSPRSPRPAPRMRGRRGRSMSAPRTSWASWSRPRGAFPCPASPRASPHRPSSLRRRAPPTPSRGRPRRARTGSVPCASPSACSPASRGREGGLPIHAWPPEDRCICTAILS